MTRTPSDWMPIDADDQTQLLGATAQGRILFTFNIRDVQLLARQYSEHPGILLAVQNHGTLHELINALERMLRKTETEDWTGQVRWLND